MRLAPIITTLVISGCAHQPPVAPEPPGEPLKTILIGAFVPQWVELCIENPDVWIATKPRTVCKPMMDVREWYSRQRAADE